ncbi:MAG: flagellar assembly protein FliH [Ectothiorhodospiraceae bacterium]|nr:flagellar assembly protein FliH [Ectothiorhodospiraceae bacterium]
MAITQIIRDEEVRRGTVSRWKLPVMADADHEPDFDDHGGAGEAEAEEEHAPRLPTAEELEQIRQAAHDEGHAEGRSAGYEAGLEEGRKAGREEYDARLQELEQQLDSLRSQMATLAEPLRHLDEDVEQQLAELSLAVARQVVHRELQTQPGEVMAVIRQAIAILPMAAREIRVHVNPEDHRFLSEKGVSSDEGAWRLVEDASVGRGGCLVKAENSQIDATMERRLNQLASQVLGGTRDNDDQNPGEPVE